MENEQQATSHYEKILFFIMIVTIIGFVVVMVMIANQKNMLRIKTNELISMDNSMTYDNIRDESEDSTRIVVDPFENPEVDILAVQEVINTSTSVIEIEKDLEMMNFEDLDYGL